jgi:phospholipid/cholesterol/gamma-HCH transport system substrate-binding protein
LEEPSVSRSLSRLQALVLGLVVLLGLGLGVLGLFTVGSRGWVGKDALRVRVGFREVRGVEVGTRVRLQGIDAGEVVELEAPARPGEPVLLHLRLKGEYRRLVRTDSTVRIVSEGLIGGKVLEIQPGRSPGDSESVADNALLQSEPTPELADLLGQVNTTLAGVRNGEGTLGKLTTDPEAYRALVELLHQSKDTMTAFQQDAEAVKKLPLVGKYVEDPAALLDRPNSERNRKYFAEEDLFEPGRAVLTATGKQRLDELAPWLEGMKHKGSEVVVVAFADPKAANPRSAKTLTQQQSEAVCDYLKKQHAIQKMGWFTSRKVTPLGQGVNSPPAPERDPLPPARVEVIVFVPQA